MPALSLVLVFSLSRALGSEGLGRYTLGFAFLYFFTTLGPLGLGPLVMRDGARDRRRLERLLANAFTLGTGASLVLSLAMAGRGYRSAWSGPPAPTPADMPVDGAGRTP